MLRVEVFLRSGRWMSAEYDLFSVSSESEHYRIQVSGHSGDLEDVFNSKSLNQVHNGMAFSTYDQDHDRSSGSNCAEMKKGGFWYNSCSYSIGVNMESFDVYLMNFGEYQQLYIARLMMKPK